ncbi:putative quinol monooxygenase [Halomonas maura]|uniref:putative quinol monooxygenase n=1 Tax=Halomonas maura TaxID=117606 RepID=UPI0025B58FAC|nr:antibiotic biosynthesis monooxygenase [Halomonas maura]MDN3556863.1 antibiotic biosynthesis monooxygenase [Halomonas maura]
MSKVVLEGYIVVPDNDLAAVTAELPTHIQHSRKEDGCLQFEVTQQPEAQNIFNVYEEFVDRHAFEAHQLRVSTSAWGNIAANVERHYSVTEIE